MIIVSFYDDVNKITTSLKSLFCTCVNSLRWGHRIESRAVPPPQYVLHQDQVQLAGGGGVQEAGEHRHGEARGGVGDQIRQLLHTVWIESDSIVWLLSNS